MRNARVFISCGQRTVKEKSIGMAVYEYFKKRGFEAYFAERVHSADALTENIFKHLRQSEYIVFVDFNREMINENEHRGSLFVSQEIAIATFLGLDGVGFLQKGTKREGILDYHIYNEFTFEDGTQILRILDEETRNWDKDSANELKIIYDRSATTRDVRIENNPSKPLSDWYHLEIINRNKQKHAFNCMGYISKIIVLPQGKEIELPTCELIWSGLGEHVVNIVGGTSREIDAFFILHNESIIRFQHRALTTSNPKYFLPQLPKGEYILEYTVLSANFDNATEKYKLLFGGTHKDIYFDIL